MSTREYTRGVCAARESKLIKDRFLRMLDGSPSDAVKVLQEVGFGSDAVIDSPFEFEKPIAHEESELASFIVKHAPNKAFIAYFLTEFDYFNLKGLIKAKRLSLDSKKMVSQMGSIEISKLEDAVSKSDYSDFSSEMRSAADSAERLFDENRATGAELDNIFVSAMFAEISRECARNKLLKKLVKARINSLNVAVGLRSRDFSSAERSFIDGGDLSLDDMRKLCEEAPESLVADFRYSPASELVELGATALIDKSPLTAFEKFAASYPLILLQRMVYTADGDEQFVYYCHEKRAEIDNVRIIMVGLLSGQDASKITPRLREY